MKKMILLALAGYMWKKFQSKPQAQTQSIARRTP
jgi:predicted permease